MTAATSCSLRNEWQVLDLVVVQRGPEDDVRAVEPDDCAYEAAATHLAESEGRSHGARRRAGDGERLVGIVPAHIAEHDGSHVYR